MLFRFSLTLTIASAGTGIFWLLGLPLPFLFGPLCACLTAALLGVNLKDAGQLGVGMRTILGVAVGASITPQVVERLPQMTASILMVPIYVILIGMVGVPFFRKVYKFDWPTAWYAAMPGGLQDMVIFGKEAGGDVRALSLIHATRVLIVITLAPIILTQGFGASLDSPIGQPATDIPVHELLIMAAVAIIGWKVGERIGLFGASILGPMILAGILALAEVIHSRPPAEAILAAQFFIGIGLGAGYVGVTMAEVRRDVLAGIYFVLMLAVLTIAFTEFVILFELAPPVNAFLAFAPGGQAEITVLAIIVGADLGYVVVHHLVRVFVVIAGAPIAAKLFGLKKKHSTQGSNDLPRDHDK